MKNETFDKLIPFIAHGMCFSLQDALSFVEEQEQRELTDEEKSTVKYMYDKYRHFGF